jgi:hypothetical protein
VQSILAGVPVVGALVMVQKITIVGVSILTGNPTIGNLFINASRSRDVHVSQASNSVAVTVDAANASVISANAPNNADVVTGNPNYSIVAENTPNGVIVAKSNEAA